MSIELPEKIAEEIQRLYDIRLVTFYQLDATLLGGSIYYFCNSLDRTIPLTSISQANNIVTVTTTNNHALISGENIEIFDCDLEHINGAFTVNVTGVKTFTFPVTGDFITVTAQSGQLLRALNKVKHNGIAYTPIPIALEGIEYNGQGSLPTPSLSISNGSRVLMAGIVTLNDLTGAKFTRIRTMRKFLDDGADPDPAATLPYDVYTINRKVKQNKYVVEFELASKFDQEGVKLPRRQMIKNTCTQRYRVFDAATGTFDYSKATCPYAGSQYFDELDVSTAFANNDVCGKRISSCKLRFGNEALPTRAFPGISSRT